MHGNQAGGGDITKLGQWDDKTTWNVGAELISTLQCFVSPLISSWISGDDKDLNTNVIQVSMETKRGGEGALLYEIDAI